MSSLTFHAAQGIVTGAALYPFLGDNVIPFGLATVLIDLDHVVEYIRDTRCFDVRGIFTYAKLTELNLKRNFLVLSAFHTVECCALIALLAWFYPMLWYVLAGMLYHMAADFVNLIKLGKPFGRAYSLLEYSIRAKRPNTITSMQAMLSRPDVVMEGADDVKRWRERWHKSWSGNSGNEHIPCCAQSRGTEQNRQ
ncbi:MAG: hypothetical protein N3B18_12530 [Desulfobacterota bacterium]|nr:hypothetical protein [Thermodesulfobacteriota bacterium]